MRTDRAPSGVRSITTVRVVIPTLDEESAIRSCLESVGEHEGVEVVVADGGSGDTTVELVRQHFPAVIVVTGAHGRGAQMAQGVAGATTDAILFLHADCRLPLGWLVAVRDALADPGVAIGCFRLHTEPPQDVRARRDDRLWWRLLDVRGRGVGLPYGDQALFLRRQVLGAVGGVPALPLMEDVALVRGCLRLGRLARVPLEVRTTGRRFARHPVRARLCTLTFPLLFRLGVAPERLARWYGRGR